MTSDNHPAAHWARTLVGRPYTDTQNCWGLVREVFEQQRGINLPPVTIGGSADNLRTLKRAVQDSGLRRVSGPPRDGDLVVLRSPLRTHVGVVLLTNNALHVLHASQAAGVVCERWGDAAHGMTAELWRVVPGLPGEQPDWEDVPQDRDSFRSILQIAAIVAINYFIPGSGAYATFGRFAATVAATAAINALLPPSAGASLQAQQGPSGSPSFSTSLQGNQARLDEPIWKVCGRREITPPFAAQPYYEFLPRAAAEDPQLDREQYFYALYAVGIGDHTLVAAKIGNTPVSRFEDVLVAQYLPPGVAPTSVNANVCTAVEVSGLILESLRYTSGFPASAPRRTCTKIAVDVVATRGLGKGEDPLTVNWRIQWRQIDDFGRVLSAWANLGADEERTAYTASPQRWTVERTLPTPARVEIRLVRVDVQDTDPSALHELAWAGLRGYMAEPAPLNPNTAHYEVVLRASSQLSDLSSRQLRLIVQGHADSLDANLDRVAAAATRNPAWWALDLATNSTWGVGKPDDRVDLQSFYDLAQVATARQDRFDYVFDAGVNAWDALQLIARSCRSRVFRRNGVISIARDELVSVPVTLFTHRNCGPGIAISETLRTRQSPDGIIAEYQDHRTWEWTEIECPCPGVETMTNPVRKRYDGIVGAKHAEREGLYDAADLLYRTRRMVLATELQGILPAYMSPVEVLPDVQGYGSTGDVVDWDSGTLTMTLTEPADFSAGPLYLRLLRDDGSVTDEVLVSPGGAANEIVLPAAPDFTMVLDSATRERPKYMLGAKELAKVVAIEDGGRDEGVQLFSLRLVVEDSRVHTADVHLLPGPGEVQDAVSSPDAGSGAPGDDEDEYIAPPSLPNISGWQLWNWDDGFAPAEFTYTLQNNGVLVIGKVDPPDTLEPAGQWLAATPVEPGAAALFEVYFAVESGATFVTGTFDEWLNLGTTRTISASGSVLTIGNFTDVRINVSIREVATGIVQTSGILYIAARGDSLGDGG